MTTYQIVLLPAVVLVTLLLYEFLPRYFSKKAENLATKEDIAEITEKIEAVKATVAFKLEVSQFRYQKEFEILADLIEKTIEFRDATRMLRPALDFLTDDEAARKKDRILKWQEAGAKFYASSEKYRPFYPQIIFDEVKALETLCCMESNRFRTYSGTPGDRNYDPRYWEDALANADKIKDQSERIFEAVRQRTKRWEDV